MMKSILGLAFLFGALTFTGCSNAQSKTADIETVSAISGKLPVLSGENVWTVDRRQSKLQFRAEHNGDKFTGSFGQFDAAIKLDLADPRSGEIHAVIDLASVDAKDDDRNGNLPSKAWFDVKTFPVATYTATDITGDIKSGYTANGVLSLKGIEKAVALSFDVSETDTGAAATGTARFSRIDFGIGSGADFSTEEWVKFPIEVVVNISAVR